MSEDEPLTYQQRFAARLRKESAEFEADPVARAQAQLDRWVESERALEVELDDTYMVGGFLAGTALGNAIVPQVPARSGLADVVTKYSPRQFEELANDPMRASWLNEPLPPDNVRTLVRPTQQLAGCCAGGELEQCASSAEASRGRRARAALCCRSHPVGVWKQYYRHGSAVILGLCHGW